MEEWKDVVGYEGLYQVSNKGNVRSLHWYGGDKVRQLKPINRNDYYVVTLCKDGVQKPTLIHRIVAMAFIPNPDGLPIINHKDENGHNNCVENLEWCDKSYNQIYSMDLHDDRRMLFANNFRDKETGKLETPMIKRLQHKHYHKVRQYTLDGEYIRTFDSVRDAYRKTGFDSGLIAKVCNGVHKQCYGFLWEWDIEMTENRLENFLSR